MTAGIILCADDYGYRPGVSAAIRDLAELGRLSAASALVTFPDWAEAARHVAALRGRIDVGLHVNLTEGRALKPIAGLAPEGTLPGLGPLVTRALSGRLDIDAVGAEIGRQIDAFRTATGCEPDFIDGHQHAHALPGVRRALFGALGRAGWRGPVRDPGDSPAAIVARGVAVPKALVIAGLSAGFARAARAAGLTTNDGFSGVYDLAPAGDFAGLLARFTARPGAAHLVMVHPGDPDAGSAGDPIASARAVEAAALRQAPAPVPLLRFSAAVPARG